MSKSRDKWKIDECQESRKFLYLNDLFPVEENLERTDDFDWLGATPGSGLTANEGGASWWLKKESSTSEFSIRVLRLSDSEELDIGFDRLGNLDIIKIEEFLRGNVSGGEIGLVSKFYDQSGNGNHLVQHDTDKMPHIADSGGRVYLRRCRPCMIFFEEEEIGGKFMYLETESSSPFSYLAPFNGDFLNTFDVNINVYAVAEMNYISGSQSDASFLFSKEVYDTPGFPGGGTNNFSIRTNHNFNTLIEGYVNGGDFSSPTTQSQFITRTPVGNCDILQYHISAIPSWGEPQYPSGARQELFLGRGFNLNPPNTETPLYRPYNSFLQGPVPFTLGGTMLNTGSYNNVTRGGFLKSSGTNPRPREIDGMAGFQGMQIYTKTKTFGMRDTIIRYLNDYWDWL